MDICVDEEPLKELAQISEEAHYDMKNRYRLNKTTMQFAKKKRMPIDERSVRDLLRNQHLFRIKMNKEIPNYTTV